MKLLSVTALVFRASIAFATAPAQARNYDCTKPGNATKAACKTSPTATTTPVRAAPVPVVAAPASAAKRNYDCSKAGNANKAACKNAAAVAAPAAAAAPAGPTPPAASRAATAPPVATGVPVRATAPAAAAGRAAGPAVISPTGARIVPWTTKTGKLVHYDCSKAGNLNKQACKQ